jgi:hypothetical protein
VHAYNPSIGGIGLYSAPGQNEIDNHVYAPDPWMNIFSASNESDQLTDSEPE